ncbi:M23 family metallopeptidase [Caldanaerobacter sp.]|uniref:M23 family metallopeptidase n=1 Tax=Caldanaerobacter sp. TaxID=2930036 RepID=UPI003C73FC6A
MRYYPKRVNFYRKYLELFENQLIIAMVFLGMVLIFKAVDVPLTNSFMNATKNVLTYDLDYENAKKGLKLVQSKIPWLKENVVKVFSQSEEKSSSERLSKISSRMILPVEGKISSGFGERIDPFTNKMTKHTGIDIEVPVGTEVKAALDGVVMLATEKEDLGKVIVLKHEGDVRTVYAHLSEIFVQEGQKVKQKEVIGKSGDTGRVTAPHLHFEVWENGQPVDPLTKVVISETTSDSEK